MVSDATIPTVGNVDELPADFFLDIPEQGSVDQLPADFFVDEPQSNTSVYLEEENTTLSVPPGLPPREIEYHNGLQNNQDNPGGYFGWTKYPAALGKGLATFAASTPNIGRGLALEQAETIQSALQRRKDFKASDLLTIANPLASNAEGAAAMTRLLGAVGLKDTGAVQQRAGAAALDARRNIEQNRKWLEASGLTRPAEGESTLAERVLFDIGNVGGSVASSVGVSLMTRNPAYAALFFSQLQKSDSYIEARDAGFSPEAASAVSDVLALAEGGLELIGGKVFLDIGSASKGIKAVVYRALEESIQEGTQTAAEEIIKQTSGMREVDVQGGIGRVLYSMALGGVAGGGVAGSIEIGKKIMGKDANPEMLDQLAKKAREIAPAVQAELQAVLDQEAGGVVAPARQEKKVAEILRKFQSGEEIDFEAVINEDPNIAQAEKDRLIEMARGDGILREDIKAVREQAAQSGDTLSLKEAKSVIALQRQGLSYSEALAEVVDLGPVSEKKLSAVERIVKRTDSKTIERAFDAGARLAARQTKESVKQAQDRIIKTLDASGLQAADKAKFIKTIKNIQSAEQLNKKAPDLKRRVEGLLKAEQTRQLRGVVSKTLKSTKVKKQSGRPVGKFTPETQEVLDSLREVNKLSKTAAAKALQNKLEQIEGLPTEKDRLEIAMLSAQAEAAEASVESLIDLATRINDVVAEGKEANLLKQTKQEQRLAEDKALLSDLVGEVQVKDQRSFTERLRGNLAKKAALGFNNWAGTFRTKLLTVFENSNAEATESFLDTAASLFEESRNFAQGRAKAIQDVTEAITKRTGLSKKQLMSKMSKDSSEVIDLGVFEHADGKRRRIEMTRSEMRKRYMELQDESLRDTLFDPKGNGYTQAIENAVLAELAPVDLQIAEAQLDFYDNYYNRINEVYRRIYNVNLPKISRYSPIRRQVFDNASVGEFLQGITMQGSTAPKGTKSRTASRAPLKQQGDFEVLLSHTYEMEYFVAFAEKVNYMRRLFGDRDIQKQISDNAGESFLKSINRDLEYFARKGNEVSVLGEQSLRTLVRNFGFAQLAAKPQIGLKQLTSFPAFIKGVKTADFTAGLVEFAANPRKALSVLKESDFFSQRGIDIDRDFSDIVNDKSKLNFLGRRPGILKFLMLPIQLGDKGAIAIGGYAHYKAKLKAGATHEQALRSFELLANRTQQSSDIDQLSELQRSNSVISRLLTQFMSSPNALARAEYEAIVNFSKGRIGVGEFAKQFFIFHILIPNLFTLMANGLNWRTEDQLQATLLGQAVGIFLIGDVIESVVSAAITGDYFDPEIRHPLDFVAQLIDFGLELRDGDVELEDFWEATSATDKLLRAGGSLTGVPIKTLRDRLYGLSTLATGDSAEDAKTGFALYLGYSPYVVDKKIFED